MKRPAMSALKATRSNAGKRYPGVEDARFRGGLLFPSLSPKFRLDGSSKVFTIGSCFARNIELVLDEYSVVLPTLDFTVDESEWPHRPNGLLNQYNPGTTSQRILAALGLGEEPEDTIVETGDGYLDLLLPGTIPVSRERALARRSEIDAVYDHLASSDLVVITLGLVECWFDESSETYLNKMPPSRLIKREPDRCTFRRLNVSQCRKMMDHALERLVEAGVPRILLTVSPVPLGTTFMELDTLVANGYSKAILRACVEELTRSNPQVDYFPSFEIVNSGGISAFKDDNIHVRNAVVERVTSYMLEHYFPSLVEDETRS